MSKINLYNEDCLTALRKMADNQYDLAIVDPPYGGGQHFNFRYGINNEVYDSSKPHKDYWKQLFRVSMNQIVWGGNYFTSNLPENRCWISWYKGNPLDSFSDFELAWTSFDKVSKAVKIESYGFNHRDKKTIHPTQKPVLLYKYLLKNYAKPGDKILDTHFGSLSIGIACHDAGYDLDAYEIDKDYFEAGKKRLETHQAQLRIF